MAPPPHGQPSPDPGLQPERTTLAWARTGLAATAAAVVMLRLALVRGSPLIAAFAAVVAGLALVGYVEGSRAHPGRRHRFEADATVAGLPWGARLAVAATVGLCAAGAVLVAIG